MTVKELMDELENWDEDMFINISVKEEVIHDFHLVSEYSCLTNDTTLLFCSGESKEDSLEEEEEYEYEYEYDYD